METVPDQLQELQTLREENNRLKILLEMREDNRSLEVYQVQSRNKLLVLMAFTIVVLVGGTLYWMQLHSEMIQIQRDNTEMKKQLGRGPEGKPTTAN